MSSRTYRDTQTQDWCCLHALNNAVGRRVFEAPELVAVRGKRGSWGDLEIESVLLNHPSFQQASFARTDERRRELFDLFLTFPHFLGFVVKSDGDHWVALRRVAETQFLLVDSIGHDSPEYDARAAWHYLDGLRGNHHAIFGRDGVDVAKLLAGDSRSRRRRKREDSARGNPRSDPVPM